MLAVTHVAGASQFGRNGFSGNPTTNGGAVCTMCHSPGATNPAVSLSGPTSVLAGSTNTYSVTISGGPGATAGVDISVGENAGALSPLNSDLQLFGEELSHTAPKAFASGNVTFSFQWTAPAYNTTTTLYAAGNSTDGMLDLLGDGVASTELDVTVTGGSPPPPPDPPPSPAAIELVPFASGLSSPVVIANAGDSRLFVVERAGRIRIVNSNGSVLATPFLDIEEIVDDSGGEQGLLGLAFHPDFSSNGYFYVYYIHDPGPGADRTRVSRFQVINGEPNLADGASEVVLLEFEQPYSNHNAGDMHFGPDGYLYIASGDGGSGGDPQDFAQNDSVLLGKILRIDVDTAPGGGNSPDCDISGGDAYAIPPGNAYNDEAGGEGCDEIYASGVRNPWRFSFDRDTGDLWIADVGQNSREEINFVLAGAAGGLDFGWRCYEGLNPFNLSGCDGVYFPPLLDLRHSDGNCSVTGGFVYRGVDHPALRGRYFFTDFCNTAIRTISGLPASVQVDVALSAGAISGPSTFGEDASGELYVASLNTGQVFKIAAVNSPPEIAAPLDQSNEVGDVVSLPIDATDPDQDVLSYTASGLPPSLTIDTGTGVIAGTLAPGSAGSYTVTIDVDDGNGGSDSVEFTWTVAGAPPVGEVIVDNQDANTSRTGSWSTSSGANPYAGQSLFSNSGGVFRWTPTLPSSGTWLVYAWWTYHPNRSTTVPYTITHAGGSDTVTVNQRDAALAGKWVLLGTYSFTAGSTGHVEVASANGQACADAVRFVSTTSPSGADLSLTMMDSPDPVAVDEDLTYTMTASNAGPETAVSVVLNDSLPAGVTFRSVGASQGTCSESSGTVSCALGDLAPGSDATVTLVVGPSATGSVTNTASVTSAVSDPVTANNTTSAETTVDSGAPPPVEVIVDNQDANTSQTGSWSVSSGANPYAGQSVFSNSGSTFRWTFNLPSSGTWSVYAWWTYWRNRSTTVPYTISHALGSDTVTVNQRDQSQGGRWILLGSYDFAAGSSGHIEVSSANGQANADAIRLVAGVPPPPTTEVIVDNLDANTSQTGDWRASRGLNPYADQSLFSNADGTFRWQPDLPRSGTWAVYAWWTYYKNRSTTVPYTIVHANGSDTVTVNQRDASLGGRWVLLGAYSFEAGNSGYVEVASSAGQACADAIRFVEQ